MKELVVLSGKGGTGKTSLTGCLAYLNQQSVLVDCDVDASNLHMIVETEIKKRHEFIGGKRAVIDSETCLNCAICQDHCRFDAIRSQDDHCIVNDLACEGCGACTLVCPGHSVSMVDNVSGRWFESESRFGPFIHGELGIGQGNSGKLVSLLKQRAREVGDKAAMSLTIVDGPPGIGCPVIASLSGADYVLIVAEPSPTSSHDMARLLQLTRHFGIRTGVCVNKYDLNETVTANIEAEARQAGSDVLGRISFDPAFTRAQKQATMLFDNNQGQTTEEIRSIWRRLAPLVFATSKDEVPADCVDCPLLSVRPPDIGGGNS